MTTRAPGKSAAAELQAADKPSVQGRERDLIDLSPILRRRRWRQAAAFALGLIALTMVSAALSPMFAAIVLAAGSYEAPSAGVWIISAVFAVLGAAGTVWSARLLLAVNRGRPDSVARIRALGIAATLVAIAGAILSAIFGHHTLAAIVFVALAALFGVSLVGGSVRIAQTMRALAEPSGDAVLSSLALGSKRLRDHFGRRPELSRVSAWQLYLVVAVTIALPLALELLLGIPKAVGVIVAVNVGGLMLWAAVSLALRRLVSRGMVDVSSVDTVDSRQPVLYLRSFASDNRRVRSLPRLYPDFAGQAYRVSRPFDEFVGNALSLAGPVIAIGEPGRKTKTIGIATEQIDDDAWQREALELMRRAGVVVILAGRTEGVRWEVEQLAISDQLDKTVFLLAQQGGAEAVAEWHALCDLLERQGFVGLRDQVDPRTTVALLPRRDGRTTVLSVKRKSAPAYALGVRAALLLRIGRKAELPAVPTPRLAVWRPARLAATAVGLGLVGLAATAPWGLLAIRVTQPPATATVIPVAPTDPNLGVPTYPTDPNLGQPTYPYDPNQTDPGSGLPQDPNAGAP